MIEWGLVRVAQALLGTDNAFSAVERGDRAFVTVIFPVIFLVPVFDATIRNRCLAAAMCALGGRFGDRPRQLIDGVPDVVASHLSEIHYAALDSLEMSLVFFVQTIFLRLVQ